MAPEVPQYIYVMFVIFTAATAIGVLIQVTVLLSLLVGALKLKGKVEHILDHLTQHALPLIATTKITLEDLSPKLKTISSNLVEVSETLKHESHNIKGSVDDVLEKTRAQTARVDEMVSGTLDGISHASAAIQHGVEVPLRQLAGIFNGLRAGFSTLLDNKHGGRRSVMVPEDDFVSMAEEVVSGRPIP